MDKGNRITLGLSIHRPEMIPFMADLMKQHEAIFLEEPPAAGFEDMLVGTLSVEDYLRPIDVEYPAFSRAMCRLLRELKAEGKQIFETEPFLQARALVYAKLITKNEIAEGSDTMPHLLDELACIQMTARLSLDECRCLFNKVRRAATQKAHEIVDDFLGCSVSMSKEAGQ